MKEENLQLKSIRAKRGYQSFHKHELSTSNQKIFRKEAERYDFIERSVVNYLFSE
jgi:hypothetical protein